MSEIKVRLSLNVLGAQRLSKQECLKNPKTSYDTHKMTVTFTEGKKNPKVKKELLVFKTTRNRMIKQNLQICKEAYDYMLETPLNPKLNKKVMHEGKQRSLWSLKSINERLETYFKSIAEDLNAKSFEYEILDD